MADEAQQPFAITVPHSAEEDAPPPVYSYPDNVPVAEQRRAFILEHLASGEIDGNIMVKNCAMFEQWLETGAVPGATGKVVAVKAKERA